MRLLPVGAGVEGYYADGGKWEAKKIDALGGFESAKCLKLPRKIERGKDPHLAEVM